LSFAASKLIWECGHHLTALRGERLSEETIKEELNLDIEDLENLKFSNLSLSVLAKLRKCFLREH
jgi:hypothetical protein